MMNFFNFNYTFPFGMNNWFMPNWSFPAFNSFPIFSFNCFNNWFNNFSYPPIMQYQIFPTLYNSYLPANNVDIFVKNSKINYAKDNLKLDDYNEFKGKHLANIAINRAVGWKHQCATYVKQAIVLANLGSYIKGDAYKMPSILKGNRNFKEISTEGIDVAKLPAGCILVYGRGEQGYDEDAGHTEITTGDGRAVSDGITKHLYKKPSNIFIPV